MGSTTEELKAHIFAADALLRAAHEAAQTALALAQKSEPTDQDLGPVLLHAAELIGRSRQAHDGELIRFLAQADRFTATPRGGSRQDSDRRKPRRGLRQGYRAHSRSIQIKFSSPWRSADGDIWGMVRPPARIEGAEDAVAARARAGSRDEMHHFIRRNLRPQASAKSPWPRVRPRSP